MAKKPTYEELEQRIKELDKEPVERKQAEENLRHRKKHLEALIEYSSLAIVTLDEGHNIISCNQDFEELFHYKESEIVGRNLDKVIAGQKYIENASSYTKKTLKGTGIHGSGKRLRKDGTYIDIQVTGVPVIIDGKVIGAYGIYQDISEQKKADEALKDSEEKYRLLVEESPSGVALISKDGKYLYLNPIFTRIFGYTLEDIPTGKEWLKKAYPHKEYRREVLSAWKEDLKKHKAGESRPQEFTVTCKDGSEKTIAFRSVTLKKGDQLVSYSDRTELNQAAEEKKKLETQLLQSQKMETIGILAGGVAHDLNNILSGIINYPELLLLDLPEDSPLR